jgi:hypothetical protein
VARIYHDSGAVRKDPNHGNMEVAADPKKLWKLLYFLQPRKRSTSIVVSHYSLL